MSEVEVIVRGLVVEGERVLLCRSVKGGYYYLPGGHVEFGEPAAAALAREFEEECGLRVDVGACGLVAEGVFDTRKRRHHEVNLVFHVKPLSAGEVVSLEPEIAFEWVDSAALTDLDVRPRAIRAWLVAGAAGGCEFVSDVPRET